MVKDFVDARGVNVIREWLQGLPTAARVKINVRIQYLEATAHCEPQYASQLRGECAGLMEIRIVASNVQYRPLGWYGPERREFTLLFGAIEKGNRLEPRSACAIALERKTQIGERGRTRDHEFD
jgi:hypothetical protein